MTATKTAAREDLCRRIRDLSNADAAQVIDFIDSLACPPEYRDHIPNAETEAALREAEDLEGLTTCTDLQDMLKKCGIK